MTVSCHGLSKGLRVFDVVSASKLAEIRLAVIREGSEELEFLRLVGPLAGELLTYC